MLVKDIRGLRTFIKNSTDNENKDENFVGYSYPVGTDDSKTIKRGFFAVYHSQSPKISERLSTVLNMAQDSQAIYEFVQNAVDCDSTAFFMHYDSEYFIALNNGRSFDLAGIRAILNFAQSTKNSAQEDNIGKFGVGFKLIHRMVGAGNGIHELTKDYTGPLLFSWSKREQLEMLLNTKHASEFVKDGNQDWSSESSPWFFKILLTCVPILPSSVEGTLLDNEYKERDDLFTASEYHHFHSFLMAFWRRNQTKLQSENLDQGSLFFLKLGHDKQKRLDEDFDYFKRGIQYSLQFVSNLMNRKGLNRVYFKDEPPIVRGLADIELEPPLLLKKDVPEFQNIRIHLDDYDKDRDISFVFGFQKFGRNNEYGGLTGAPNFYKFFPMGKEDCGLNFILHCNVFQIDTSRRELVQHDPLNKLLFAHFVKAFIKRLEDYKTTDPERFRELFLTILFSNDRPQGTIGSDRKWIYEGLYEPLLNFFSANVPVGNANDYQPAANVVAKTTVLNVTLQELGIPNYSWLYWNVHSIKGLDIIEKAKKINIHSWGIGELIRYSEINAFRKWYLSLDELEQHNFSDDFADCVHGVQDNVFWAKVVAIPELIHTVEGFASTPSKIKYISSIPKIILETNKDYAEEDYEFKLLQLVKAAKLSDADAEAFRAKVFIKDDTGAIFPLKDVRENDKIKFVFENTEYLLSAADVLPEYQTKSKLLGGLIQQFEERELPLTRLLGLGKSKQPQQIHQLIVEQYSKLVTPHQFVFVGYYSELLQQDVLKNFDMHDLSTPAILDCYFKNNYRLSLSYVGKYLIPQSKIKVISTEWSIVSEQLDESILHWLASEHSGEKINFLATKLDVNADHSPVVKIRKALVQGESVDHHDILASGSKQIPLLIHTLRFAEDKKLKIKSALHADALRSIFATCYNASSTPLTVGSPVAFIGEVSENQIESYWIGELSSDALLYDRANSNLSDFGMCLADIVKNEKFNHYKVLDAELYSSVQLHAIHAIPLVLAMEPDWARIPFEIWHYQEAFFMYWMEMSNMEFLFLTNELPQLLVFQGEVVREVRRDNYCYDATSNKHFICLQPPIDPLEKASAIVEAICLLPDSIVSEKQKNDLAKAYSRWVEGEEEDVAQFSKRKINDVASYSFEWLRHIFDWEYHTIVRKRKAHVITFDRVVLHAGMLSLSECSDEIIPARIEFITEPLVLRLKSGRHSKTLKCKIMRYGEFELNVLPVTEAEELYLTSITDFRKYRAMLELPEGDMLMDNLRDNLFGQQRVIASSGDMRNYFIDRIAPDQISFLFGPPGTGKTTRIALDLLLTLYKHEQEKSNAKILVLTPTNKAADVVLERIVSLMSNRAKLKEAAAKIYPAELMDKVANWSNEQRQSKAYQKFLIRMGNSDSPTLYEHNLIYDRQNADEIPYSFIVCTTVHRLGFDNMGGMGLKNMDMGWTHLVLDESSMISLPHAVFALAQFSSVKSPAQEYGLPTRMVVSGDPFQLKAVGQTPSYIDQANGFPGWQTENVYTLFQLEDFETEHTPIGNFTVNKLMKQFRSVPLLGQLFSDYKYAGLLRHHQQTNETGINLGGEPLENIVPVALPFFDKRELEDEVFVVNTFGDYSAYQIYSIVLACELAFRLKQENPSKSVGIISPYGTQARLLREISAVFAENFPNATFNASTVHRYQGDENEIIILLMIPSSTSPAEFSHFNNANLINVGISRAKECLILMQPAHLKGFNEVGDVLLPMSPIQKIISGLELEKRIFKGCAASADDDRSPYIYSKIEVKTFLPFNISDLVPFTKLEKEYLFFAGNRNVNVIMNLKREG